MKSSSSPRRRTLYVVLTVLTIAAGLILRKAHLGLPLWLVKYGGSALWAIMIYWLLAAIKPSWDSSRLAIDAALIATIVELFKLYHAPLLDDFRRTLAGALLLGRFFSWWDIAAYCLGILIAAVLCDPLVRRL